MGTARASEGALPPQCAALNMTNIAVQELAVKAVLERDKEAAFHACALDSLTASMLSLPDIRICLMSFGKQKGICCRILMHNVSVLIWVQI